MAKDGRQVHAPLATECPSRSVPLSASSLYPPGKSTQVVLASLFEKPDFSPVHSDALCSRRVSMPGRGWGRRCQILRLQNGMPAPKSELGARLPSGQTPGRLFRHSRALAQRSFFQILARTTRTVRNLHARPVVTCSQRRHPGRYESQRAGRAAANQSTSLRSPGSLEVLGKGLNLRKTLPAGIRTGLQQCSVSMVPGHSERYCIAPSHGRIRTLRVELTG